MTGESTAQDAAIYMEICAALMTAFNVQEVDICLDDVPNKPFQIWRRVEDGKLTVRLVWEDQPSTMVS